MRWLLPKPAKRKNAQTTRRTARQPLGRSGRLLIVVVAFTVVASLLLVWTALPRDIDADDSQSLANALRLPWLFGTREADPAAIPLYTSYALDEALRDFDGDLVSALFPTHTQLERPGAHALFRDSGIQAVLASYWWPGSDTLVLVAQGPINPQSVAGCHVETRADAAAELLGIMNANAPPPPQTVFPVIYSMRNIFMCNISAAATTLSRRRDQAVTLQVRGADGSLALLPTVAMFQWSSELVRFMRERKAEMTKVAPRRAPRARRFELCVVTQARNMAHELPDWVRYHHSMGVDAFFIYMNNNTDSSPAVLDKLDRNGARVFRINWPFRKSQLSAFQHSKLLVEHWCSWTLHIDVDEYVAPTRLMHELAPDTRLELDGAALQAQFELNLRKLVEKSPNATCRYYGVPSVNNSGPAQLQESTLADPTCMWQRYGMNLSLSAPPLPHRDPPALPSAALVATLRALVPFEIKDLLRAQARRRLNQACLSSQAFGSSGHVARPATGSVPDHFVHRPFDLSAAGGSAHHRFEPLPKCAVQLEHASFDARVHYFVMLRGRGSRVPQRGFRSAYLVPHEHAFLIHYKQRSWEEFMVRFEGRNGNVPDWPLPADGLAVFQPPRYWAYGHVDIYNATLRDARFREFKREVVDGMV